MAKAKYKIGTLVQFGNAKMGVINTVLTRESGFSYFCDGHTNDSEIGETPEEVTEDMITNAFRAVKPRTMKPRMTATKKNKNKETHAN